MRELALNTGGASAAIEVTVTRGLDPAIDEAAALACPARAFLRRAWFAAAEPAKPVTIVARRPDGRLVAALPIGAGKRAGLPVKAVPGCYWPFRSFPVAADAGFAEIVALLGDRSARKALGPAWRLGPVYADDPAGALFAAAATSAGWRAIARPVGTAFLLEAGALHRHGEWPRTSTLKKNRWFERQLADAGPLDVRMVSGSDWGPEIFDALAGIEAASWIPRKTGGEDAKFLSPQHRRFWEAAAADPVLGGMLKATILTIGGRPAAFTFDIECGGTCYTIANSYDEQFARWSPGRVLAYRRLVPAVAQGLERIDWGSGDSGYKRTVGAVEGPAIVDLLFVRNRVLGAVLAPLWARGGDTPPRKDDQLAGTTGTAASPTMAKPDQ